MITPTSFTDKKIFLIQVQDSDLYFIHFQPILSLIINLREIDDNLII